MAKSPRICQFCEKEFMAENKFINLGRAKFCSKECRVLGFIPTKIEKEPNKVCTYCNKEFFRKESSNKNSRSGHYFCSRVCKQEAQKDRSVSEVLPSHYGRIMKTKQDVYRKKDGRSIVSRMARSIYKASTAPKHCVYCRYDAHYEVCHIRAVSDFPPEALISDINALSNLVALCPNHHWEFDHGKLQWEDIVLKMNEIKAEELEELIFEE